MSEFLVDLPQPGTTACIVVGQLDAISPARLALYRDLLWCGAALVVPSAYAGRVARLTPGAPDLAAQIERFLRRDPRHLPALLVTADAGTPAYAAVLGEIHTALESAHRTRLTRQQDGFTWQRHILQNIPAYVRHRLPADWAGALRGLPAIVCGAGPSLDVSLPALAAAASQAVVFAADSALRALDRVGVAADFAVSIDAAKVPEKCLPPTRPPARVLLASVSPPAWSHVPSETPPLFLSSPQVTDDWLATHDVARTALAVSESCGSTALALAEHLGCGPIYLFGLDLAVDDSDPARRHQKDADPALYRASNYDPTVRLPRVPGNYAETVPCFALGDWRALDARLADQAPGRVFNITDRGARLRGTTVIHPGQFTLPAPTAEKGPRLARLTAVPREHPAVLTRLAALGARAEAALPVLRRAFAVGGPADLAAAFRPLVTDPELGRALGAFSLKLMPHLVPPTEGDRPFWAGLLEEYAALVPLLRSASTTT